MCLERYLGRPLDFPGSSDGKASAYNTGDPGSIPGSGRSPGEGNGNPLQCSCLENPMDGGAWWATVHGVTELDMTDARRDWGQQEKGTTEDEMAGWHHGLNGHELEQALGDGEG